MDSINLYLLSTYLKKWSFGDNRITLNYSFSSEIGYERSHIDMRINSPINMTNEFLNNVFYKAKEKIHELILKSEKQEDFNANNISLVNEAETKQKLSTFLTRIVKEFNQNKNARGRSRMISTRSLDFYYNDFEFEPLDDEIKFYVHLNRGANKMNGDLWSNAVGDFKLALEIKPDNLTVNKYMAMALNKLGKFADSVKHLKIYAVAENTAESLSSLIMAYIHLDDYKNADKICTTIEDQFPDSFISKFIKSQLAYRQGKGYKTLLDKIYKKDPEWLQNKIKSEWEFKIPGYQKHQDNLWNAATAARYLGFDRPFDLTRRAFNEEIPSYFNSEKGTIRFVKEELDLWVEIMNRYKIDNEDYSTYADRLLPAEKKKAPVKNKKK